MKKILTVTLSLYKPSLDELNNFFYSVREINYLYDSFGENQIEFLIVSDNPSLCVEITNFIESEINKITETHQNIKYVPAVENLGKTWQIIKNLDKINGRFIKLADPDDFLIPKDTFEFVSNFLAHQNEGDLIVVNSYNRVFSEIKVENFSKLEKTIFYKENPFNPNSTYSKSVIEKVDWDFNLLVWSDDLMGFIAIKNGAKIIGAPEHKFYINSAHAGVSVTKKQHSNLRFYNDTILYLDKVKEISNNQDDLKLFNQVTQKPSAWMLEKVYDDLDLNISLSDKEKIVMKETVFSKMLELTINKDEFKISTMKIRNRK